MAVLLPSVAVAQNFRIFAAQKIVVADVIDRNDRPLDPVAKKMIRQNIVDACTASEGYEVFEINMDDIKRQLKASGKQPTFLNICQMVKRKANVEYILFPEVRTSGTAVASTYGIKIYLDASLYRIDTESLVKSSRAEAGTDQSSVMAAIDRMVGELLGVKVNRQMSQQTYQQPSYQQQQQTYQQPSYQQQSTYSQAPQSYVEDAGCGLNLKMVYVEGGSFRMGATQEQGSDAESDESPVHTVRLDSYYIAECELTQAQWEKIMGTTIYQQRDKANAQSMCGVGDNNPMYYVSWEEAQAFCRELSAMTGKTYLLPTEAQWEYAARGGNKSKGYKYSGSYAIDAVAWYGSNSGYATHAVKQKRANELGLYDMSGNVWEWCSDWYGSYSSSEQSNPTGDGSGPSRVLRGGCWTNGAGNCRVSSRFGFTPSNRNDYYGFRVVCLP